MPQQRQIKAYSYVKDLSFEQVFSQLKVDKAAQINQNLFLIFKLCSDKFKKTIDNVETHAAQTCQN
jgi:hypothetical protein